MLKKLIYLILVIYLSFLSTLLQAKVQRTDCDNYADFYDNNKVAEGVIWNDLDGEAGILSCTKALKQFPNEPRFIFQLGRSHYKMEEFDKAHDLFLKASKLNYPNAFMELGYMHYLEDLGEIDYDPVKWFSKAFEFNVYESQRYLGLSYSFLEDFKNAEMHLLSSLNDKRYQASDKPMILYQIADNYYWWDNHDDEALDYFYQSIKNQYYRDHLYEETLIEIYNSIGYLEHVRKKNKSQGLIYYNLCLEEFNKNKNLEFINFEDIAGEATLCAYNIGTLYEEENQNIKAVKFYNLSIDIFPEESHAYNNLALIYQDGKDGVKQNYAKAFEFLSKALKYYPDDSLYLSNIGYSYEEGKGVEQSFENAIKYYTLANENENHLTSYLSLGYLYENGYGVKKDIQKAIEIYKKAVVLYETSNDIYADFLSYEKDTISDYNLAKELIEELSKVKDIKNKNVNDEYNIANQCAEIESLVSKGDNQENAFLNCLSFAQSNNPVAQFWIGYFYENGIHVFRDYSLAAEWFKKSMLLGDEPAKFSLLTLILNGYYEDESININNLIHELINEPKNKDNEYNYYYEANFYLALVYKYGINDEIDYEKSIEIFNKIIKNSANQDLIDLAITQLDDIKAIKSGFAVKENIEQEFPREFKGTFEWESTELNKYQQDWNVKLTKIHQVGPKRYKVSGNYYSDDYIVDLNGYIDSKNKSIELWESNPTKPNDPEFDPEEFIIKGSYFGFYDEEYNSIQALWLPQTSGSRGFLKLYRNDGKIKKTNEFQSNNINLNWGKYYAVVIGNNAYEHLDDLETARLDAQSVANVLENKYGFEVIKVLIDATRKDILSTLNSLKKKLGPYDNLLIYYAGHGYLDETNRGYWLPVDANSIESEDNTQWISSDDITNILTRLPPKHILVVADSCYSGSLIIRGQIASNIDSDNNINYYKQLLEKKTRKALTSGALQPVLDGGGQGHSIFANAFLKILSNNNQILETTMLFNSLNKIVTAGADQTPLYNIVPKTGDEGGDFIFVPIN